MVGSSGEQVVGAGKDEIEPSDSCHKEKAKGKREMLSPVSFLIEA